MGLIFSWGFFELYFMSIFLLDWLLNMGGMVFRILDESKSLFFFLGERIFYGDV